MKTSRRKFLADAAAPALLASTASAVLASSVIDDRKARLLRALADFDAAASAEQIAAKRLNAIPTDGSFDREHERARIAYEKVIDRLHLADSLVTVAARKIDRNAAAIITRDGVYVVIQDEDCFVGQRIFYPAARAIDLH